MRPLYTKIWFRLTISGIFLFPCNLHWATPVTTYQIIRCNKILNYLCLTSLIRTFFQFTSTLGYRELLWQITDIIVLISKIWPLILCIYNTKRKLSISRLDSFFCAYTKFYPSKFRCLFCTDSFVRCTDSFVRFSYLRYEGALLFFIS